MWPEQKDEGTPSSVWMGQNKRKTRNFIFLKVHRLSRHRSRGYPHACSALVSSLVDSHELCVSQVVGGVHKLTSRTSVGVLDWSCCSLALFPALTLVSCWHCWPCCRLVASTRSICSWHALRQSWNKKDMPTPQLYFYWTALTHRLNEQTGYFCMLCRETQYSAGAVSGLCWLQQPASLTVTWHVWQKDKEAENKSVGVDRMSQLTEGEVVFEQTLTIKLSNI